MSWKKPDRQTGAITQPLNDGIVQICDVVNAAEPGFKPIDKLLPKGRLRYENQRVGIQRYYQAMQNQVQVDRVIRVARPPFLITSQDVAVTEDGREYNIRQVQSVDNCWPECLDLTLTAIEQEAEYALV